MKNKLMLFVLSSLIVACNNQSKKDQYITSSEPIFETPCPTLDSIRFCEDKTDIFCSNLPLDVYYLGSNNGQFDNGYSSVLSPNFQPSFDNFSWQSFVALNWPADDSGNPLGSSLTDHPKALRVWEHYTNASAVFNAGKKEIMDFTLTNPSKKVLSQSSKVSSDIHLSSFVEADDYPLIDKNLNFVVYEVKMNPVEQKFIEQNNLTTKEGIYNYYKSKDTIILPVQKGTIPGAIEVKASWRILDINSGDDLTKYYTQNATIYITSENSISGESFTFDCTIGLVGLHILRKTEDFGNWIWSTFEHVDNVPDNLQQAQSNQESNWSFYNPECLNCPMNQPPKHIIGDTISPNNVVYRWDTKAPYATSYATIVPGEGNGQKFGTQVSRVYPLYFCTEQVNTIWRSKLSELGSVFANYKLVGTQWMVPTDGEPPALKINAPTYLGNTTSETYMQEGSSCINCHAFATIDYVVKPKDTITIHTDFSFTFSYAQ